MMTRLLFAILLTCWSTTACAQDAPDVSTCEACHRDGPGPRLDGQKIDYLRKQLRDFRKNVRSDPLMGPVAKILSARQIDELSEHYSRLPAPRGDRGRATLDPATPPLVFCVRCHGARGISPNDLWPNLAGLDRAYMRRQVEAFATGARRDDMMKNWGQRVDAAALEKILAYFAADEDASAR